MIRIGWTIISMMLLASLGQARILDVKTMSNGDELGLAIMGSIINHADPSMNVALVKETETGRVKAVKAGYPVLDGYTVTEVDPKYILLSSRKGESFLVYHDKFAGEFQKPTKKVAPASGLTAALDTYSEEGFERRAGKITMTASFRDKVINQDLSKILMQATAIPNYVDGALKGFRLLQIDAGSIFDNSGFRDNDVITSINGTALTNVPATIKLLHSLKNENNIDIEYVRDGQYQTTSVNVN